MVAKFEKASTASRFATNTLIDSSFQFESTTTQSKIDANLLPYCMTELSRLVTKCAYVISVVNNKVMGKYYRNRLITQRSSRTRTSMTQIQLFRLAHQNTFWFLRKNILNT